MSRGRRRPAAGWAVACGGCVVAGTGLVVAVLLGGGAAPGAGDPGNPAAPAASPAGPDDARVPLEAFPAPTATADPASGAGAPVPAWADDRGGILARVDARWVDEVAAATAIPARALAAYAGASLQVASEDPGCGLGWNTLAGIGEVESGHGTIGGSHLDLAGVATPPVVGVALAGQGTAAVPDTDGGALDGDATWDRAVGPMQFIPSTWQAWAADGDEDGVSDPQDVDDSALAAARYLCHVGGDLTRPDRWIAAIGAYNATVEYNNRVAEAASRYGALG